MILVIEDDKSVLEMLDGSALIATNAKTGLDLLKETPEIRKVYCDFHGIQRDNLSAHDIFEYCMKNSIEFIMTSSDADAAEKFKVRKVSKVNMLREVIS